jgi:uncharacterized protein YlbG (UPF0298 family)
MWIHIICYATFYPNFRFSKLTDCYGQIVKIRPTVAKKLHETFTKAITENVVQNLQIYVEDNELDQKFKKLEDLSVGRLSKQSEKAW